MAALTQRMEVVEERTDSLESILAAFMARTDASMARTDEAMARTDGAIGRLERIIERGEHEGAREREERRKRAERDRKGLNERAASERREMNERWVNLVNKMGTLVEDIVAPGIRRLARQVFDCGDLRYFATRTVRTRSDAPSREREFEALYVGTQAVLLNETKAVVYPEYPRAFVKFLESGQFARQFPEYRDLPIVPVFSSLSIPADVGHLSDTAGYLCGGDGRRGHAGAQPGRGAQAQPRTLTTIGLVEVVYHAMSPTAAVVTALAAVIAGFEGVTMTFLKREREEGRREGRLQGRREGRLEGMRERDREWKDWQERLKSDPNAEPPPPPPEGG